MLRKYGVKKIATKTNQCFYENLMIAFEIKPRAAADGVNSATIPCIKEDRCLIDTIIIDDTLSLVGKHNSKLQTPNTVAATLVRPQNSSFTILLNIQLLDNFCTLA